MTKTCSILRLNVEGSGVVDGDPVGVVVGVGVGDGFVVDVVTVTKESSVSWTMGSDVLGSLSMGG
jgi:hypothetical protein